MHLADDPCESDMADAVGAHAVRSHPGMGDEGFALGWSLVVSGRLASGEESNAVVSLSLLLRALPIELIGMDQ